MTQQMRVNPLVEGALLAVITAIMGAMAVFLLPIKFIFDFAWAIPAIIIIKRHNVKVGILSLLTAAFLTWVYAGPLMTGLLFVELAPLAVAYGILFKKESPPGRTVLIGTAVSVLSTVVMILLLLRIDPVSIIPSEQVLRQQSQMVARIYSQMGMMSAEEINYFSQVSVKLVRVFIPSFFIFSAALRAFVTYVLTAKVFRRLGYKVLPLPPFSQWRLPWYSIWVLITGLGLTLLGDQYNFKTVSLIGKVTVCSALPLFFLIGLAVFIHFIKRWKIPVWIKVLIGFTAVINWTGTVILFAIIGIFDPFVSFRNRKRPKE